MKTRGFATLLAVLVVGVIGAAIAFSLLGRGASGARLILIRQSSVKARSLANACAEEALGQIRSLSSFVGSNTLILADGTCVYTVTSLAGENRIITASGQVGSIIRRVKIILDQINPSINVTSWQEVADF